MKIKSDYTVIKAIFEVSPKDSNDETGSFEMLGLLMATFPSAKNYEFPATVKSKGAIGGTGLIGYEYNGYFHDFCDLMSMAGKKEIAIRNPTLLEVEENPNFDFKPEKT